MKKFFNGFVWNTTKNIFEQTELTGELNLNGCFAFPLCTDIHTHGAVGYDFNTVQSFEDINQVASFLLNHGSGKVLATVMTDSIENMTRQISLIADYVNRVGGNIIGIHLEGPFLCETFKGAMPSKHLLSSDTDILKKLIACGKGTIKLITLSPELNDISEVIKLLVAHGIAVSLGHSGASGELTVQAIKNGATNFTHTFNAMPQLSHKSDNILSIALTSDCFCELICDGMHLTPTTVNILSRCKSDDRIMLVTDSIMATGLGDGEFNLAGEDITVTNGDALLTGTTTRAGSTLTAVKAISNYMKFTSNTISQIAKCCVSNPNASIGIEADYDLGYIAYEKSTNTFTVHLTK